MKRESIQGYTFEMEPVAGGMFTQVRVFMIDGPRVYCKSHATTTEAELDYAKQKEAHGG
jgi:hypothetical protein